MTPPRKTLGLFALLMSLGAPLLGGAAPASPPAAGGRVVVLGFDGASYGTAARMIEEGRLPNLARLAKEGTFAPLGTTLNAESAVAWAALNTGQNPSKTGIPGFIKRDLLTPNGTEVKTGGMPQAGFAFQRIEERRVADMHTDFVTKQLAGNSGSTVAAGAAAIVFVAFMVVFKLLLKLRFLLALVLSVGLSGLGGFAAWRAKSYVPESVPGIVANPLQAAPVWELAAQAGIESIVLDAAMTWDREPVPGARVLAGLGLPDSRGGNGDWFIYTTDDLEFDRPPDGNKSGLTAGTIFRVDWITDAEDSKSKAIETELFGPIDFYAKQQVQAQLDALAPELEDNTRGWKEGETLRLQEEELKSELSRLATERLTVPLRVEQKGPERVRVTVGDSSQEIVGESWSDWFRFTFQMNPLLKMHAVTRVRVLSYEPFTLFVSTLDMDPANPPFWQPISQPAGFSGELASATGEPYETFGWACITMPFKSEKISPEVLMEDLEFTMKWRERLVKEALARDDWRLLVAIFSTPDRTQHMLYQYHDPEHPLYDPEVAHRKTTFFGEEIELADAIPAIYEQVDRIVGEVLESLEPEDTLLVCADHGFQSFRHQFNVNNWLAKNGYLVLREDVRRSDRRGLAFVDWSRTRAYALGLGTIYLNLAGREAEGIVQPEDADALMREIATQLEAATDDRPGRVGDKVIDQVVLFKDVHSGPYLDLEGDLMIGFAPYYRVSWSTTLGGIGLKKSENGEVVVDDVFEDNDSYWSGGHVSVAPSNVPGIFFSNRKLALPEGGADLLHIAPTSLSLLGLEVPAELDLAPLAEQ